MRGEYSWSEGLELSDGESRCRSFGDFFHHKDCGVVLKMRINSADIENDASCRYHFRVCRNFYMNHVSSNHTHSRRIAILILVFNFDNCKRNNELCCSFNFFWELCYLIAHEQFFTLGTNRVNFKFGFLLRICLARKLESHVA